MIRALSALREAIRELTIRSWPNGTARELRRQRFLYLARSQVHIG